MQSFYPWRAFEKTYLIYIKLLKFKNFAQLWFADLSK